MKNKALAILLWLTLCGVARGGVATLAWDYPSNDTNCAGFFLFGTTNSINVTNLAACEFKLDCLTNKTVQIKPLVPGRWEFAVTAYASDKGMSDPSNILPVTFPQTPTNATVVVLQYSASVVAPNWKTVGFIMVKSGTE